MAGILLARQLLDSGPALLDDATVIRLAAEIEGHPDNVAPCVLGGFTIAWNGGAAGHSGARALRLDDAKGVLPVIFVPVQRPVMANPGRHSRRGHTSSDGAGRRGTPTRPPCHRCGGAGQWRVQESSGDTFSSIDATPPSPTKPGPCRKVSGRLFGHPSQNDRRRTVLVHANAAVCAGPGCRNRVQWDRNRPAGHAIAVMSRLS